MSTVADRSDPGWRWLAALVLRLARRKTLAVPNAGPLASVAVELRHSTGQGAPDADPADGGVSARQLLLKTPDPVPDLTAAVLAERATVAGAPVPAPARPSLPVLRIGHPSPTYFCTSRAVPQRIAATLAEFAAILGSSRRSIAA